MTISDDIFKLIKSLEQTEKRYFKVYSSLHVKGKKNIYVRLFEAIEKQEQYDEAAIIKQFRGENFLKQFAVTKNYLYKIILRSLRSYHSGRDKESELHEELESAKILYGKGHYKKSMKIVKKAKQVAWEYQRFEQLLSLLEFEGLVKFRASNAEELNVYLAVSYTHLRAHETR